jgi:hypothetical protein
MTKIATEATVVWMKALMLVVTLCSFNYIGGVMFVVMVVIINMMTVEDGRMVIIFVKTLTYSSSAF